MRTFYFKVVMSYQTGERIVFQFVQLVNACEKIIKIKAANSWQGCDLYPLNNHVDLNLQRDAKLVLRRILEVGSAFGYEELPLINRFTLNNKRKYVNLTYYTLIMCGLPLKTRQTAPPQAHLSNRHFLRKPTWKRWLAFQ